MPFPGDDRSDKTPSIDAARERMFFRPWPAPGSSTAIPVAVIRHHDDPTAVALQDRDHRAPGTRVLAHVRETFLHDPEHLDLLVGAEGHSRVDLHLDVELAVGDEEVDVAP